MPQRLRGIKAAQDTRETKLALNILVFVGLLFFLGAIGALIGAAWAAAAQNNVAVGNLVRTTFTGCPAVLTTALWGPTGEYAFSNTYGNANVWAQDATNALHCDMPGARGTYSTWLSGAGQAKPGIGGAIASNSVIYWTEKQCTSDADCYGPKASLTIPCGPGISTPGPWLTATNFNGGPPYAQQCPGSNNGNGKPEDTGQGSWCSICAKYAGTSFNTQTGRATVPGTAWEGCPPDGFDATAVGQCMGVDNSIPFRCAFETPQYIGGGTSTNRQCAAFTNPGINPGTGANTYTAPFGQYLSCEVANNWSNTNYGDFCSTSANAQAAPWICQNKGNWGCPAGQVCAANWNPSVTGWCIPGDPCPTDCNNPDLPGVCTNSVAGYVCSGTVLPNVVMQTIWIAEGEVVSQNGDNSFEVQWNRVQNTYNGIGPSVDYVFPGPKTGSGYTNQFNAAATEDLTWRYADCRFVADSSSQTSRNTSVSAALLGVTYVDQTTGIVQSASDPLGLDSFQDPNVYTPDITSLLAVQVFNFCPPNYSQAYPRTSSGAFQPQPGQPLDIPSFPQPNLSSNGFQGKRQINSQVAALYNGVPCNPLTAADVITAANTIANGKGQRAINSVWNLQAHEVDATQLKRIFFYSILPFNVTDETLGVYSQSYYLAPANDMMLGKPPRF